MFADENSFFSPAPSGDYLSAEPRKSVGAPLGAPLGGSAAFGGPEEGFGFGGEAFSQGAPPSQRTGAPPAAAAAAAAQTPDGCLYCTAAMLRKAVKERAGGGPLLLHGAPVGMLGLCGVCTALEVRPSLFRFTLEDPTAAIEVECSSKAALALLQQEEAAAAAAPPSPRSSSSSSSNSSSGALLAALKNGGLVSVFGYACTDDKGAVYIDCCRAAAIKDPREYAEAFPLRVIAAALRAAAKEPHTKAQLPDTIKQEAPEEASLEQFEHITEPLQRLLLKTLMAAEEKTMKRHLLQQRLSGHSPEAIEEALKALEDSGEIALTATWVSLAS
ncbi:hypothetical protein, conserved [Eimeria tenella]|uniref:Uncharacterized protein n=1 Tax=Eimeria tenella TaxID=5802 RepID=U6KLV9_EIMTE|nr:hypothetical protein, conserved [Eimeria tenella]CDJ39087.1 hypothetical protein, conserved [Eimeria tenella]|eukprot:XP_013229842.1 hypothetical protein, conserved [Eimeria tenella]